MSTKHARLAYVAVITDGGEYRLGIAKEGESGYYAVDPTSDAGGDFNSHEEASKVADAYNENLGLSKEEAFKIIGSTMFRGR